MGASVAISGPVGSRLLPAVSVAIRRESWRHFGHKIYVFGRIVPADVHKRFSVMFLRDEHVERWNNEQGKDRADGHAANENETDRISCRGSGAGHECERKVAGDSCDAGHHDWPQPNSRGLRYSRKFRQTLTLEFIGELDNENAVLGNKTDQSHQSDLRINVKRGRPPVGEELAEGHLQKHEYRRTKQRQRDRAQQNDQRITEAVKLCSKNKENQQNREEENSKKTIPFQSKLAGAPSAIDHITRGEDLTCFVLQKLER